MLMAARIFVSQHDELLMVCGVMGAKTYDVYTRTADQIDRYSYFVIRKVCLCLRRQVLFVIRKLLSCNRAARLVF
jgi:hypothetical protein